MIYPLKICTYALSQFIKLNCMVPHGDSEISPNEYILGKRKDVSDIRVLGEDSILSLQEGNL